MFGEFLGQLVVRVVAAVHEPPYDARLLHQRQVPVGRTLRQARR